MVSVLLCGSFTVRRSTGILALAFFSMLLCLGLTACGGGSGSTTPTPDPPAPPSSSSVTVALSPHLAAVTTSQSQTLTATLTGGTGTLSWFVDGVQNGNASAGTIASTGDTTAAYTPSSSTTPGGHSITAQVSGGTLSSAVSVVVTDLDGVFTNHNDNARTGQNIKEYALTPTTVSAATFGKLFSCPLDSPGYVYAQPLYVANLTMNDGLEAQCPFRCHGERLGLRLRCRFDFLPAAVEKKHAVRWRDYGSPGGHRRNKGSDSRNWNHLYARDRRECRDHLCLRQVKGPQRLIFTACTL